MTSRWHRVEDLIGSEFEPNTSRSRSRRVTCWNTGGKTSVSGAGDMGFKFRTDQILDSTLSMTRDR